jgi:hypothetical protein
MRELKLDLIAAVLMLLVVGAGSALVHALL